MTNGEKYLQVRREAAATGLGLLLLIVFWVAAGFGAAQIDIKVFKLPLWVWTATVGTWMMAIVIVRVLTKRVFREMRLEEDEHRG